MATKKKAAPAEETVETVAAPAQSASFTTVKWRGMERVYSLDIHGADYLKLAKSFAEKVGGTLV